MTLEKHVSFIDLTAGASSIDVLIFIIMMMIPLESSRNESKRDYYYRGTHTNADKKQCV